MKEKKEKKNLEGFLCGQAVMDVCTPTVTSVSMFDEHR